MLAFLLVRTDARSVKCTCYNMQLRSGRVDGVLWSPAGSFELDRRPASRYNVPVADFQC